VDILDKWLDDLPQQFQGKKYIEALISVFAKQLEDLYKVFKQLDAETDLDSAVGMNFGYGRRYCDTYTKRSWCSCRY